MTRPYANDGKITADTIPIIIRNLVFNHSISNYDIHKDSEQFTITSKDKFLLVGPELLTRLEALWSGTYTDEMTLHRHDYNLNDFTYNAH